MFWGRGLNRVVQLTSHRGCVQPRAQRAVHLPGPLALAVTLRIYGVQFCHWRAGALVHGYPLQALRRVSCLAASATCSLGAPLGGKGYRLAKIHPYGLKPLLNLERSKGLAGHGIIYIVVYIYIYIPILI